MPPLTVLSIGYPFAAVGPDAVGGAEQILSALDYALVSAGHNSIVVSSSGSQVAGTLVPTGPIPSDITDEERARSCERHRHAIAQALAEFPIDLVHCHAVDFAEHLPETDTPTLVTLHLPRDFYPQGSFQTERPCTWYNCVSASQRRGLTEAHGDDRLEAVREQYDRAVATAPEAAVALYSLGDPAILDRATAELTALLEDWGLLGADRQALDIGCGIGRMELALAPRLRHILGIDLSPAMIAEAKRRCAGTANAVFALTNGRGLTQFADQRFDLVLAVDSFPCIVGASPEIARQHILDAGRLLRPGGSFAIFNYSYRCDLAADRAEVGACAETAGLLVLRNGTRDLALWDGTSFLLKAPFSRG